MQNFTPWSALAGGVLIGLAATMLLLFEGRVAGISGILGGLVKPAPGDVGWRGSFVVGLLLGGLVLRLAWPAAFGPSLAPLGAVAAAGLIVGVGTRAGSGCTSGHGVCGNSRFSVRSMVATVTFIATGAITVFVMRHVFGSAS